MLEYLSYKKFKKNRDEKAQKEKDKTELKQEATASTPVPSASKAASAPTLVKEKEKAADKPVLDDDEQSFFERLTSGNVSVAEFFDNDTDDAASRPDLPPRMKTPELTWDSDSESFVKSPAGKGKEKETAATSESAVQKGRAAATQLGRRISVMVRRPKKDVKPTNLAVPEPEADKEKDDLSRVLDDLNLSAKNNRAFSLSNESAELVQKFTLVLKDLVNGVPTAVDDLKSLLDDKDGHLKENFEKLPGSMKKLVETLPAKLTSTLAPELLVAAAGSQGIAAEQASKKSVAKSLLMPKNLAELVTKPSAIVSMLKAIMNTLKLRWPAFIGTNVIWSVALFILMFVLWYCHKRGREVRLDKEKSMSQEDSQVAEEEGEASGSSAVPITVTDTSTAPNLPPPPIGADAPGRKSPVVEKTK